MTQEEILEGNKIIAEFMTDEPAILQQDLRKAGTLESMHYHEYWDWLLPAIFKYTNKNSFVVVHKDVEKEFSTLVTRIKLRNEALKQFEDGK